MELSPKFGVARKKYNMMKQYGLLKSFMNKDIPGGPVEV